MLWNDNEEAENGRSECEEDGDTKIDTVKTTEVETVTVTGKGTWRHVLCINYTKQYSIFPQQMSYQRDFLGS